MKQLYLYKFEGYIEFEINDKLIKIRHGRIGGNIDSILVNGKTYFGEELKNFDELVFEEERIIYHERFLFSSLALPLSIYKIEYQVLPDRIKFKRRYKDNNLKPQLEVNLKRVTLSPNNRGVNFVSFLPMVMMSLASLPIVVINVINKNGYFSIKENITQLIMPLVMLLSTLILQPLIRFNESRRVKKDNNQKISDFENYLVKQTELIRIFKKENDSYLNNIYLDQDIINRMIKEKNIYIYSKDDEGFLKLTLGRGQVNFDNLVIKNNNSEDNKIYDLAKEFIIKNTKANIGPIILDLKEENNSTFIINEKNFYYLDYLFLSIFITTFPTNLKTCVLIDERYKDRFLYLKEIKHVLFNNHLNVYQRDERQYKDADLLIVIGHNFHPTEVEGLRVINVVEDKEYVPAKTSQLITIDDGVGSIKRNNSLIEFHFKKQEVNINEFIKLINQYEYPKEVSINNIIPLLDLYPVEHSYTTLKAVLGQNNQGVVTIDLDETKDGPHGLICGMTGSGKSELLLTMVLSLSINYSPTYLNFVIVDFKGGGIVNVLNNSERKLKHLVSSLTNIDGVNFERILVSFKNECLKRQNLFKQASLTSGENVTNIKEYHSLLKSGAVKTILPHLVIILDEFAEIKKEHSEVIDEFLSISRIGRSLGIHLILCTQRAQGVIDDEIRSNAGFKICLKVNSKEDSREVIETNDAETIKEKGGFYLLTNNYYKYGKSAYTNADVNKNYLKKTELLNGNLETIDRISSINNQKTITESVKIIDVINKRYSAINLEDQKLWLDELVSIKRIYRGKDDEYSFGIVDDFHNKKQFAASFSYLKNNLVVSLNKKQKQQHLINSLNDLADKDVDVYLLDLSRYKINNSNFITIGEKDDYELRYLVNLLNNEKDEFIKNTLIIITDLKIFTSIDEDYQDILRKALEQSDNHNYKFLIYTNISSDYSYSFSLLFDRSIYLGDLKSDEVMNMFSKNIRSSSINDGLINYETPLEFKLYQEQLKETSKKTHSLIKYIKQKRMLVKKDNEYILGQQVKNAKEFVVNFAEFKQILITSYDLDFLEVLKEVFKDSKNIIYVNAEELRLYRKEIRSNPCLFFKNGLIDNYDLSQGIKDDLEDDEMMFIYKRRKERVKYFNEWN